MHIMFFIGSMGSGGAERVISILANEYAKKNWNVEIAHLLKNDVNYDQSILDRRIKISDLSMKDPSYKKGALKWLGAIRKHIKKEKPDCVVSFVGRINALVLTATIGLDVPILVSERNDPRHDGRGKAMLMYCNLIYHRARMIAFQTKYESQCFLKSLKYKSMIIPNPVSVEQFDEIEAEHHLICTAGRLAKQKNQLMLIDSIKILKEKYPAIRCEIYGVGPEKQKLQQRINELNLNQEVCLAGTKTDIHKWVAKSQVFVLTSEFEGQSNALIEAMMLGKPVITTDYPGANEVIENNISGLIVPRGDAEALAHAVSFLLDDEQLYNRLRDGALAKSKVYRMDVVLQQWERAIDSIIK